MPTLLTATGMFNRFLDAFRIRRYSYAVLTVAVIMFFRLNLRNEITDALNPYPFLLFHAPVLFSAWFFGRGAGIVATITSVVSIQYFLMPPDRALLPVTALQLIPVAVFIGEGIVISLFASAKREAEQKLKQHVHERRKELKAAHRQLIQNEALAAVGTGVSKISHEMANRVHSLTAGVEMLELHKVEWRSYDPELDSITEDLKNETRRLCRFIRELRELSRPMTINPELVEVADVIAGVVRFHCKLSNNAVEVEQCLTPGLPPVMADRDKLQEALVNLCKNSIEAMPNGGKITIMAYEQNGTVWIEVKDTGVGIPKDLNVFDLFTTSKEHGWGLGLPIVRQIILAHKGDVDFTSTVGEGTTFKIALPVASGEHSNGSVC